MRNPQIYQRCSICVANKLPRQCLANIMTHIRRQLNLLYFAKLPTIKSACYSATGVNSNNFSFIGENYIVLICFIVSAYLCSLWLQQLLSYCDDLICSDLASVILMQTLLQWLDPRVEFNSIPMELGDPGESEAHTSVVISVNEGVIPRCS